MAQSLKEKASLPGSPGTQMSNMFQNPLSSMSQASLKDITQAQPGHITNPAYHPLINLLPHQRAQVPNVSQTPMSMVSQAALTGPVPAHFGAMMMMDSFRPLCYPTVGQYKVQVPPYCNSYPPFMPSKTYCPPEASPTHSIPVIAHNKPLKRTQRNNLPIIDPVTGEDVFGRIKQESPKNENKEISQSSSTPAVTSPITVTNLSALSSVIAHHTQSPNVPTDETNRALPTVVNNTSLLSSLSLSEETNAHEKVNEVEDVIAPEESIEKKEKGEPAKTKQNEIDLDYNCKQTYCPLQASPSHQITVMAGNQPLKLTQRSCLPILDPRTGEDVFGRIKGESSKNKNKEISQSGSTPAETSPLEVTNLSPVSSLMQPPTPSPTALTDESNTAFPTFVNQSSLLNSVPLSDETNAHEKINEVGNATVKEESIKKKEKGEPSETKQKKIVLKYNYKENQWSPLNPEGKKQYDRDFLLMLQTNPMSLKKPSNLPNLKIIIDEIRDKKSKKKKSRDGQQNNEKRPKREKKNKIKKSLLFDGDEPKDKNEYEEAPGIVTPSKAPGNSLAQTPVSPLMPQPELDNIHLGLGDPSFADFLGECGSSNIEPENKSSAVLSNKSTASSCKFRDDIMKKTTCFMDEFLCRNKNLEEAVQQITEQFSPNTMNLFITKAITQVLEYSSWARCMFGQLLHHLVKSDHISMQQYNKGFEPILKVLKGYTLAIPIMWEYLGEIIQPMIEGNCASLRFLQETIQPCIPSIFAGKLMSTILHYAVKEHGKFKACKMWHESGLEWIRILPPGANILNFIKLQNLEFTVYETKSQFAVEMQLDEMQKKLQFCLSGLDKNEEIFDWVESNIGDEQTNEPNFIHVLVTTVIENAITGSAKSCQLSTEKLKAQLPVLIRYVGRKDKLQLQALYSVQAVVNSLSHPEGVLRQIFDILHENKIVTEETFTNWEVLNPQR